MENKCGNCKYFKRYNENSIYGSCVSNESKRRTRYFRSEKSPICVAFCLGKNNVEKVENIVEKKLSNKRMGSKFEKDFADYLSKNGYWVAPFPGKEHTNSQPADLIICKNNKPILIDCKTLANKNGTFNLERLEENQRLAYKRFKACGNKSYYLAILWNNNVYMVNLDKINFKEKSINVKDYACIEENFYED